MHSLERKAGFERKTRLQTVHCRQTAELRHAVVSISAAKVSLP